MNIAICPARNTDVGGDDPEPCLLFVDHPGRHDFAYDIEQNVQGLLHRNPDRR